MAAGSCDGSSDSKRDIAWDAAGSAERILRVDQSAETAHQPHRAPLADPEAPRLQRAATRARHRHATAR